MRCRMKFVFKRCAASEPAPSISSFFLLLQHFVRDTALTIALHQFVQRRRVSFFNRVRRQIELDVAH